METKYNSFIKSYPDVLSCTDEVWDAGKGIVRRLQYSFECIYSIKYVNDKTEYHI